MEVTLDLGYVLLTALFFILAFGFALVCDRLNAAQVNAKK